MSKGKKDQKKDLVTVAQVAEMLGVRRQAVDQWIRSGKIAWVWRPWGRVRLICVDEVARIKKARGDA